MNADDALKQEFKELYATELAQRDTINQSVDRPITIITAFLGIVYFAVSGMRHPLSALAFAKLVFAAVSVAIILVAMYYLIIAYWNHTYRYLPTALDLSTYRKSLAEHFCTHPSTPPADIDAMVLAYIYEGYINGAHQNAEVNRVRSGFLHRAKTCLICALPFIILLGLVKTVEEFSPSDLYRDFTALMLRS